MKKIGAKELSALREASSPLARRVDELTRRLEASREDAKDSREREDLYRAENDLLEQKMELMLSIKNVVADTVKLTPKVGSGQGHSVPIFSYSDNHLEERVVKEKVNGLNEYAPAIAERRSDDAFRIARRLNDINRAATIIDDMVLDLGGDHITGFIHQEYVQENFLSPTRAILFALKLIRRGIHHLLADTKLKRLHVVCTRGNHGRTTEKRMVSTASDNSYEYLMYHILASEFADNPRITFAIAEGDLLYFSVYDFLIRSMHGDNVGYQGGIGGVTIPLKKYISRVDTSKPAYLTLVHHFHSYTIGSNFIVNGSGIGYTPFALNCGFEYEPPQLSYVLLNEKLGRTIHAPIILGKDMRREK